ncbi:MAG: ABC transporter ATP-binding protein, partial [Candidatus Accumulibacter sp.]|nr:ABC transporter ATP-binding protein [Accumulibacter sp.]
DRKLQGWQKEKAVLDEELADPAAYTASDRTALEAKLKRQAQLEAEIGAAEERWLEIQMELEELADPQ